MWNGIYYTNSRGTMLNRGCVLQSLEQTLEYKQVQLTYI